MRKPDFFIVGAPKCGTTAMSHYLRQHPQVFMPEAKEINFFGADLAFTFPRVTEERYLAHFSDASNGQRVGEASVWYLYSTTAAREIKEFNPRARIVIMLRKPVDMMYSLYCQRRYNGNEDIDDFRRALAAEGDRSRGLRLPKHPSNLMGCFYQASARFTDQVRRYLDTFGRDTVHVIIFDDFTADTARVYRATCEFLAVDPDFQPDFRIINAAKRPRSAWLRDVLRSPLPPARWLFRAVGLRPTRRGGYKGWLKRFNSTSEHVPPLDPELRRALQREFLPEVETLSQLLGRDLSHWCHA